jgi:hypothetical protein
MQLQDIEIEKCCEVGLQGLPQQAINHTICLRAIAPTEQIEMINDVIQVIECLALLIPCF